MNVREAHEDACRFIERSRITGMHGYTADDDEGACDLRYFYHRVLEVADARRRVYFYWQHIPRECARALVRPRLINPGRVLDGVTRFS